MSLPDFPVYHHRYIVQAYSQWQGTFLIVCVSVMYEDGKPVTNLNKQHFQLANIGDIVVYTPLEISSANTDGSLDGFYVLTSELTKAGEEFIGIDYQIFAVQVHHTEQLGKTIKAYRGQCLSVYAAYTD